MRKAFKVYQNRTVANNSDKVNELGWDEACKQIPGVEVYLDNFSGFGRRPTLTFEQFEEFYTPVLTIAGNNIDLDDVFRIGNMGPKVEAGETLLSLNGKNWSSISVGNVIEDEEGNLSIVAGSGFVTLSKGE